METTSHISKEKFFNVLKYVVAVILCFSCSFLVTADTHGIESVYNSSVESSLSTPTGTNDDVAPSPSPIPSPIVTPGGASPSPEPNNVTPSPIPTPIQNNMTPSPTLTPIPTPNKVTPSPTPKRVVPTPTPKAVDYKEGLKKLGYYKERSKDTNLNWRNAIVLFQSDHNLKVDGSWGKQSSGALNKRLTAAKYTYLDKVTTAPSKGKWITINKTKRILTLYLDKTVIKKYPIAVGNPPSLTPDGKFKIVNKIINPAWGGGGYAPPVKGGSPNNPLGYRWMGLSIKGGSSYGIHGTNSPYSIGTNASHGCIRMPNFCVEELFSLISLNTDVWIGSEEKLSSWGVTQPAY